MSMVKDVFFYNLDFYIKKKGLTKTSFARELGLKQTTISSWFSREAIPVDQLDKIAKFFSIEVSELFIRDIEHDYAEEFRKIRERHSSANGDYPPEMWAEANKLGEHYSKITGGADSVLQVYAEPLGRVLPGLSHYIIELLRLMLPIKDDGNENFYHICILLHGILGDAARDSMFDKFIRADHAMAEEYEFRKKKLIRIVSRVTGYPIPGAKELSIAEKLSLLTPIEHEHIEHLIDSTIAKMKSKQSVS